MMYSFLEHRMVGSTNSASLSEPPQFQITQATKTSMNNFMLIHVYFHKNET